MSPLLTVKKILAKGYRHQGVVAPLERYAVLIYVNITVQKYCGNNTLLISYLSYHWSCKTAPIIVIKASRVRQERVSEEMPTSK